MAEFIGTAPHRPPVGFRTAMHRWWAHLFQFSGRASRSEFWWPQLLFLPIAGATTVAGWVCEMMALWALLPVVGAAPPQARHEAVAGAGLLLLACLLAGTVGLAVLVLELGLLWRRLHDHNLSGLWAGACLALAMVPRIHWIAAVDLVVLLCLPPDPRGQRFDQPRGRDQSVPAPVPPPGPDPSSGIHSSGTPRRVGDVTVHDIPTRNHMSSAVPPYSDAPQAHRPGAPFPPPPRGANPRPHVDFMTALKLWWAYRFRFSGRASRSEFWWVMLFLQLVGWAVGILVSVVLMVLILAASSSSNGTVVVATMAVVWVLLLVLGIGLAVMTLGVMARRLHDANFSALMLLFELVGLGIVPMIMCILPSDPLGQRFDTPSDVGRP